VILGREHTIHFIGQEIAALLTNGEEVAELIVFFLGNEHEGLPLKPLPELPLACKEQQLL
jgi:hypothetical protein